MKNTALTLAKNESDAIQALRFAAAMLVLVQHCFAFGVYAVTGDFSALPNLNWFWNLQFGPAGVGLFFVISGFIMSMKLDEHPGTFLAKRFIRIYPAFWMACALSVALQYLLIGRHGHTPLTSVLLLPSTENDSSLMIPFWTLRYEVVFYVLCTWACASGRLRKHLPVALVIWLGLIQINDFYGHWVSHSGPSPTNIMLSRMNIYFIAGILLGRYRDRITMPIGISVCIAALTYLNAAHYLVLVEQDNPAMFIVTVSAAFAYAMVLNSIMRLPFTSLTGRLMSSLGDCSYGIYLTHFFILFISATLLRQSGYTSHVILTLFAIAFPTSLLLAVGEHRIHRAISQTVFRKTPRIFTGTQPTENVR